MRDNHAHIRGLQARIMQGCLNGTGKSITVLANTKQRFALGHVCAAQILTQDVGPTRCRRGLSLEHHGACTLAQQATIVPLVKRSERIGLRDQTHPIQIQKCLRLDRRIVADGNHPLCITLTQRPSAVDDGQQATGCVVGDATIGPFELVTDADVAQHIIG